QPLRHEGDLDRLTVPDVEDRLHYVMEAIGQTKEALQGRVPLIGCAGAPWTVFCYMVQGKGSKTFDEARSFCYRQPALAHRLLQMITDTSPAYLPAHIRAGADVVQLFASWAGLWSPADFMTYSFAYLEQIVTAVRDQAP